MQPWLSLMVFSGWGMTGIDCFESWCASLFERWEHAMPSRGRSGRTLARGEASHFRHQMLRIWNSGLFLHGLLHRICSNNAGTSYSPWSVVFIGLVSATPQQKHFRSFLPLWTFYCILESLMKSKGHSPKRPKMHKYIVGNVAVLWICSK